MPQRNKKCYFIPVAITAVNFYDLIKAYIFQGHGNSLFEEAMAGYFNKERGYSFTSLMRTNLAFLEAIKKVSPKSEVVLPRYCCPSFIHGVLAAKLKVKFIDVLPSTLSYNSERLFNETTKNFLAIICANLFGLTNPVAAIKKFCVENEIYLAEGVDYGIGTEYEGRRIGTLGDFTILNFQEGKAIPIGGGMIVTDHSELMKLYNHRRKKSSNCMRMVAFSIATRPFFYYFFMKLWGSNRKEFSMEDTIRGTKNEFDYAFFDDDLKSISDFQGKLGLLLLSKMEKAAAIRWQRTERYRELLGNQKGVTLIAPEPGVTKIHYIRFPIRVEQKYRDKVVEALLRKGIEASPMYIEHGMNVDKKEFPGAYIVSKELVTLPCHQYLTTEDVERVAYIIKTTIC